MKSDDNRDNLFMTLQHQQNKITLELNKSSEYRAQLLQRGYYTKIETRDGEGRTEDSKDDGQIVGHVERTAIHKISITGPPFLTHDLQIAFLVFVVVGIPQNKKVKCEQVLPSSSTSVNSVVPRIPIPR